MRFEAPPATSSEDEDTVNAGLGSSGTVQVTVRITRGTSIATAFRYWAVLG